MWSDPEALRTFSHALMWASGILAMLAAIATGGRYYLDRRVGQLSSIAQSARLEAREQEQAQRESQLRAELAASERAQQERERELRQRLADSTLALEDSKTKIGAIEERSRPRNISAPHRAAFVAAIKGCESKTVSFVTPIGDAEALSFAKLLEGLFHEAGWTSNESAQGVFTGVPTGVIMQVPSKDSYHPCALVIQKAFASIGIEAPGEIVPGTKVDVLHLVVGRKP